MSPFELVSQISTLLQKSSDETQTYPAIFQVLNSILPFDAGTLYVLDDKQNRLQPVYQQGEVEVDLAAEIPIGSGRGLSGWIAQQREPAVFPSLAKSRPGREGRFQSLLALPLVAEDKLIGVLNLGSHTDECYRREEMANYRILASELSLIIDNLRLQANLRRRNQQLQAAIEQLSSLQAQLVEKERLAAIGELIITVNHEINNPLTSIMGYAEILNLSLANFNSQKFREGLHCILNEARRIQRVTHQLANLKTTATVEYYGGKKMLALHKESKPNAADSK